MAYDMIQVILDSRRRAKRVLAMRVRGKNFKTFAEIGAALGVSKQAAHAIWRRGVLAAKAKKPARTST